jgi:hypothetical protein
MYGYYTVATYGIRPWWKSYITTFQILQFVLDLSGVFAWAYGVYILGHKCQGTYYAFAVTTFVLFSFLGLFIHFYVTSYRGGKRKQK